VFTKSNSQCKSYSSLIEGGNWKTGRIPMTRFTMLIKAFEYNPLYLLMTCLCCCFFTWRWVCAIEQSFQRLPSERVSAVWWWALLDSLWSFFSSPSTTLSLALPSLHGYMFLALSLAFLLCLCVEKGHRYFHLCILNFCLWCGTSWLEG